MDNLRVQSSRCMVKATAFVLAEPPPSEWYRIDPLFRRNLHGDGPTEARGLHLVQELCRPCMHSSCTLFSHHPRLLALTKGCRKGGK